MTAVDRLQFYGNARLWQGINMGELSTLVWWLWCYTRAGYNEHYAHQQFTMWLIYEIGIVEHLRLN